MYMHRIPLTKSEKMQTSACSLLLNFPPLLLMQRSPSRFNQVLVVTGLAVWWCWILLINKCWIFPVLLVIGKSEKKETKKSEKPEAEVVLVKPAPWKHVVQVSDDFGPEDVKVYVRDGRIRVEGRRERNVGGDDDVVEVLEVNRELQPPSDVILDDLSVFFRSGGRLELEAPRRVQRSETAARTSEKTGKYERGRYRKGRRGNNSRQQHLHLVRSP